MTHLQAAPGGRDFRLLIRPNCSLGMLAAWLMFGLFALVAVGIGTYMVMLGAWPVLPFLGLELALLAIAFVMLQKRARFFDLLVSEGDEVCVTKRDGEGDRKQRFHRYWMQVRVASGPYWYPSKLLVGSHGQFTEIGAELTEEDRLKTATQLRGLLRT
ncbi:MAG: DUF2244 domain-containing protein [Gammaproteobacteria bacterium]